MKRRKALVNAALYPGDGTLIDTGFIIVDGSIIEAVGSREDFVRKGDLEIIDLGGGLILPGLMDAHIHLVGYALSLKRVNLADSTSLEEGLNLIVRAVARSRPGSWLFGRGWDKQRLGLETFPDRSMLDRVAPHNPVVLTSRDGHLLWVNSLAIPELELEGEIEGLEGGEVERDARGRPTGIIKEKAAGVVLERADMADPDGAAIAVREACERLASLGLTCVHTIETAGYARLLDRAIERGLGCFDLVRMFEIKEPVDIDSLEVSPRLTHIKIMADGTLGSQTASMLEPFCGQPDNVGMAVTPKHKILEMVRKAVEAGFSVAVHAIGDRANMDVLDVYEEVAGLRRPGTVLRVEHAQVLRDEDIRRFADLEVVASMQPIHLISDMDVADRFWGERCGNAYAWKSIIDAGGRVAFGSDAPIEDPDPLRGIHAAVARRDPRRTGAAAWHAEQCIATSQAVDCYTRGGAIAAGTADLTGTLARGARANLTVLGHNVFAETDPDAILDAGISLTMIGGEIAFSA